MLYVKYFNPAKNGKTPVYVASSGQLTASNVSWRTAEMLRLEPFDKWEVLYCLKYYPSVLVLRTVQVAWAVLFSLSAVQS